MPFPCVAARAAVDLQPDRLARDTAGLQPALPGVSLDDPSKGQRDLQRLSQPKVPVGSEQAVKGLNFFNPAEQTLLKARSEERRVGKECRL